MLGDLGEFASLPMFAERLEDGPSEQGHDVEAILAAVLPDERKQSTEQRTFSALRIGIENRNPDGLARRGEDILVDVQQDVAERNRGEEVAEQLREALRCQSVGYREVLFLREGREIAA